MEQALGPLAGRTGGLGRRLQQRRPLAGRGLRCCSAPHVRLACPFGYDADDAELERLALLGAASVAQTHRPAEAVAGADAVHADTWVSMGQEADKAARKQAFEGFTVDADADGAGRARTPCSCTACRPTAGLEVTADVIDGPRSVVFQQGHNRLARGAAALLGRSCCGVVDVPVSVDASRR